MENTLRQRITSILELNKVTVNYLSKKTGVSQVTLNKQINGVTTISAKTLLILLDYFKDISAEWLLRGEGDMTRSKEAQDFKNSEEYQKYKEMEELFIEFNVQTNILLEEKDKRIRELELRIARVEAEKIVEKRRAG